MASPTLALDSLRLPPAGERPKFSPEVPDPVQAHIWITWLRKTAARRRLTEKTALFVSLDGADDLAALIERLASQP